MGVGIYIVWPAFYTDVTDAYRLGSGGRLRTDLGGIYFNAIFALAIGGAVLRSRASSRCCCSSCSSTSRSSTSCCRSSGSTATTSSADLTGVPDLFARIKPILREPPAGDEADERVTELKPWVRVVVTAYVLIVVPLLAVLASC